MATAEEREQRERDCKEAEFRREIERREQTANGAASAKSASSRKWRSPANEPSDLTRTLRPTGP